MLSARLLEYWAGYQRLDDRSTPENDDAEEERTSTAATFSMSRTMKPTRATKNPP
jgi:hypothetical protein